MLNRRGNRRHGSSGMTLVELMLVMVILSVVMLAVMSLYVPAHQSTVAQAQVADVQSNLRLAVDQMTKDLLTAGFLVPVNPVIFEANSPVTAIDHYDFTIRSRAVGNAFIRVKSADDGGSGNIEITATDKDMVSRFPVGSRVRLFEPMTGTELNDTSGSDADRAYEVTGNDPVAGTIDIDPGSTSTAKGDILPETVVIRVRDTAQPPIQKIRYRLVDGALVRKVNDNVQYLARNMDSVYFDYVLTPENRVQRVDIVLRGKTTALKDDAISGEKVRQVNTSVTLRNIY